jgi:sugar/nucleoside kinase (ribokinase family)
MSRRVSRSGIELAGPHLVALGDLLLDVVVAPARIIQRGTDVPGTITFRRGGSAANTSAAFALMGGTASLITSLGSDAWVGRLVSSLRDDGVHVHAVRVEGPSGRLVAIVDARGERSFITQRGVADALRPTDIKPSWLRRADVLHVPAYSMFAEPIGAASLEAGRLAREAGLLISSDLSSKGPLESFGIRTAKARLRTLGPDILFANRDEAAALLRQTGVRAWSRLLDLSRLVVVKDGDAGCRVLYRPNATETTDSDRHLDVAAERIGHIDSTGAGDAFAAGFLFSLIESGRTDPRRASWSAGALRKAALAGHRTAAAALRRRRPEIRLA